MSEVTREEFSADVYPAYCSGIAWVVTIDVVRTLNRIANRVKIFWIDDVYITGILMDRFCERFSVLFRQNAEFCIV